MKKKKAEKKYSPYDLEERRKLCHLIKDALYDLERARFYKEERIESIKSLIKELKELEEEMSLAKTRWQIFADQLKTVVKKAKIMKAPPVKKEKEEMPELMVT